jgi:hypothetical protein
LLVGAIPAASEASTAAASAADGLGGEATPSPSPAAESASPAAQPAIPVNATPPKAQAGPAGRLSVRIEHQFRKASIRIWVDDRLVLDQGLDSRTTRRALFFTERKGVVEETLKVPPGRHELQIQLKWDENVETRRIAATFKPGATRRLEIVAGGGRFSLDWD